VASSDSDAKGPSGLFARKLSSLFIDWCRGEFPSTPDLFPYHFENMKFFCGKQYAKIDLAGFFSNRASHKNLLRDAKCGWCCDWKKKDEFEICLCIWNI
jgi:hypothetical protein